MSRSQVLKLPVGDVPDWEVDGSDNEPADLKSPAESFVILQSLKQSRDKWLREMFPKFSSRGRGGKQPDIVLPPHTIYNRGRCTLQIGPHSFADTTVFEVHYRLLPVAVSQPTTFVHQPAPTSASSQVAHQPQPSSSLASPSPAEPNELLSSLTPTVPVPPGLVTQVNSAATANPTISNLLHLAASGQATPEQLKSLGLLIQSMANPLATNVPTSSSQPTPSGTDSLSTPSPTVTQQYQYQTPKEFDIVLEFRETPSDRWLFPRGPATWESVSASRDPRATSDLKVSTIVPFSDVTPPQDPSGSESNAPVELVPRQVVEFHFKVASTFIWDTFSRWVGPKEKMEENRKVLMEIEPPDQKFLAYRLPQGSQLTQIQNAALPSYTMKLIKPSNENGKPKRRPAPRKSTQDLPGSPLAKRKRQAQSKTQVPPPKIACFACGEVNVPLIMGGRYCRPCVEGGRAGETSQAISTPVESTPQSSTPQPDKTS